MRPGQAEGPDGRAPGATPDRIWLVPASVYSPTLMPVKNQLNTSGMNSGVSAASRSGERSPRSAEELIEGVEA
jgi:hypothetical protein